jgi:hypothetical protein
VYYCKLCDSVIKDDNKAINSPKDGELVCKMCFIDTLSDQEFIDLKDAGKL